MVLSFMRYAKRFLAIGFLLIFVGCAGDYEDEDVILTPTKDDESESAKTDASGAETAEEDFKEEESSSDPDEEGDLTAEEIPEEEELTEEEECSFNGCEEEEPTVAGIDSPSLTEPAIDSWTPNNSGPAPTPVRQADLRIDCTQLGAGLEPGYLRFGCKAYKQNGRHYGIVKGWWSINRSDGNKAKSKSLNFRESGYDMAFDVLESDAAAGISVAPGAPPPSI
jgi:hypothetical protein